MKCHTSKIEVGLEPKAVALRTAFFAYISTHILLNTLYVEGVSD